MEYNIHVAHYYLLELIIINCAKVIIPTTALSLIMQQTMFVNMFYNLDRNNFYQHITSTECSVIKL